MIYANEPFYNYRHPPVMLSNRTQDFICAICGRPGVGPQNIRVHPGRCKEERGRQISARTALRKKAEKQRARELAATC